MLIISWARRGFLCRGSLRQFIRHAATLTTHNDTVIAAIPLQNMRNFCIIAHIDHGKSTLADRLLELTGKAVNTARLLDRLQVEQERGITVKAQTATMVYPVESQNYLLNLVDTPGHVDFADEVRRSLMISQGCVLLVDATQGIQAQTIVNHRYAKELGRTIIPVLNKIDLATAKVEQCLEQLETVLDVDPSDVIQVSAKDGTNVSAVLDAVVALVPAPPLPSDDELRVFLYDALFDKFKGVICCISVVSGSLKVGSRVRSLATNSIHEITQVGIMTPEFVSRPSLETGQVGYMTANIKKMKDAICGDTFTGVDSKVTPLMKAARSPPVVFAGLFPIEPAEFEALKKALEKLLLTDPSVTVVPANSACLGQGFRLGCLGTLHLDVLQQRLEQEYAAEAIITSPTVTHQVKLIPRAAKRFRTDLLNIEMISQLPEHNEIEYFLEPWAEATIIFPDEHYSTVLSLCTERRGILLDQAYIDNNNIMFTYDIPLSEIVVDFFDRLKSVSSGYASLDYKEKEFRIATLQVANVALNGREVEELSFLCHTNKIRHEAKKLAAILAKEIPRQQYEIIIQVKVNTKPIARETIRALRKDVTRNIEFGGDMTRRVKRLEQQKEGKARMKLVGNVMVPKEAFINIARR